MTHGLLSRILVASTFALPLLAGCSGGLTSTAASPAAISVTGNWQFSSKAASASALPAVSGALSGTNTAIAGVLHSNSAASCISPSTAFAVTGSADANNKVTLTGAGISGGTFTLTGTLATDGKSITNSTYTVTGGNCAFSAPAAATAQVYAPISGTYTGTFTDQYGDANPVSVTLTQTSTADANGNFNMSGTGTFPANACFSSPSAATSAQVTGDNFNVTYTDPTTQETITVGGTFASDASTLTLTVFQIAGPCGNYNFNISGTLTRR